MWCVRVRRLAPKAVLYLCFSVHDCTITTCTFIICLIYIYTFPQTSILFQELSLLLFSLLRWFPSSNRIWVGGCTCSIQWSRRQISVMKTQLFLLELTVFLYCLFCLLPFWRLYMPFQFADLVSLASTIIEQHTVSHYPILYWRRPFQPAANNNRKNSCSWEGSWLLVGNRDRIWAVLPPCMLWLLPLWVSVSMTAGSEVRRESFLSPIEWACQVISS